MLDMAYSNGDFEGVVDFYAHILDYEEVNLDVIHLKKVLESLSFIKRIDHFL